MLETPTDIRRWPMLAILLLGQFMALLDLYVVNVAMPTISADLHASGAWLQLVISGYIVAYAMMLITGARLGSLYGHRRMYLTGAILFTLASLGCALAPVILVLVLFRFVQGIAAAVMVPQIMSVMQTRFTGADRAKALSAYGVVLSAGSVAGVIAGGLLVGADLFGAGWRPVFGINLPIGLLLILLVPRLVPADRPAAARRLDLTGLAIATVAVLLIVLPLVVGHEVGWPLWTFGSIAAGLFLAAIFVRVERQQANRGGDPLLNLDVLRAPGLSAGLLTLACMQLALGGFMFVFTLHLQAGLGQTALRAGLTFLPLTVTFGLVGYFWRSLPQRVHYAVVPTGLALCGIGYAGIAVGGPLLWIALAVAGAGMGLSASPLVTQSLRHVPFDRATDASGVLTTTMQLSQVGGVAAFGTLFLSVHPDSTALTTTLRALVALSALGALLGIALARQVRNPDVSRAGRMAR
jgi:MFS family permease